MTVSATARPTRRPDYSETLPRKAESAVTARRVVRATLEAWGLEHAAEDGALIVTELVANSVNHARGRSIRIVVVRTDDDAVRVGVMDKSRTSPRLRYPTDNEVHGRGLALVDALATRWGTDINGRGKGVWAELQSVSSL